MPRPQNNRTIYEPPIYTDFKPIGVRNYKLEVNILSLDEFEAIRLADYLGLSHEECAKSMKISRPTFTRLIEKARKTMSDFIINGKRLSISGGNIHFTNNIIECEDCKHIFKTSMEEIVKECPECKSEKLENLAHSFGHGKCCMDKE